MNITVGSGGEAQGIILHHSLNILRPKFTTLSNRVIVMNSSVLSRDVVLAALKNGFSDSQIASSCRVTQSAVSQFIDSHELRQYASANSKFESLDKKYNNLEEVVLDKLAKSIELIPL